MAPIAAGGPRAAARPRAAPRAERAGGGQRRRVGARRRIGARARVHTDAAAAARESRVVCAGSCTGSLKKAPARPSRHAECKLDLFFATRVSASAMNSARGKPRTGGGKGAPAAGGKPKVSREEKKAGRRAAQARKIEAKTAEEARYFWACADRGGDAPPRPAAATLFAAQSTGINFAQYESIPVTRGRVSAAAVPPLRVFADVAGVPAWLKRTLTARDRMAYETPTPIQKHTIPLALAGRDP
jgi:hypothetical protein